MTDIDEKDRISHLLQIWEKTVDVQQHFNDIELRIRNYAITIVGAMLGVAGLLARYEFAIGSILVAVGAIGAWRGFYFMDRHWYHRLLYGAVRQGKILEEEISKTIPEMQLTKVIGEESPVTIKGKTYHSPDKIDFFYKRGTQWLSAVLFGFLIIFVIQAFDILPHERKGESSQKIELIVQDHAVRAADGTQTGANEGGSAQTDHEPQPMNAFPANAPSSAEDGHGGTEEQSISEPARSGDSK